MALCHILFVVLGLFYAFLALFALKLAFLFGFEFAALCGTSPQLFLAVFFGFHLLHTW